MKVVSLALHPVVVSRRYGTVIAQQGGKAKKSVAKSYFYFVEVKTDNGLTGWGEMSDIDFDKLPKNVADYADALAAFMKGRNPFDLQKLHHDISEHFDIADDSLARAAACALDMAMYDLIGKYAKRPVYDLLGGAVRKDVVISWVAYIREELDLLRDEIRERVKQGFRAFKLKVGVDIDLDEKRLALTREVAGRDAIIKVDANAGWSVKEAPRNIRRLHKYQLAGVETPVPREDPADIAAVRKQVDVPILEHVGNLEYALALIKAKAIDVMNISLSGAGGLFPARQIVALAQAARIGVLVGSTVELGPGTLAQLHFAATIPNLTLPSDLIGPGMYTDDVLVRPLQYQRGRLAIPRGIGLGENMDRQKMRELKF
ncbi:MAG: dipeptide epimerase [Gemmatales bacterium]|nr:MAG: dipeptide epimerase [Gemmatales bacterium]